MDKSDVEKFCDWEEDKIDLELDQLIERLACTNIDDATICHVLKLDQAKFNERFKHLADGARGRAKIYISMKQMECAGKGNPQMLIWLGKQMLGQKEPKDENQNALSQQLFSLMQGKSAPLIAKNDKLTTS